MKINNKYTWRALCLFALIGTASACDSEDDQPTPDPVVESAIMDPEVRGPSQPNQVYIDLSSQTQTVIERNSWDLGFYAGSEFRVILNNSTSALAKSIEATDLASVTAEDTLGMGAQLDIDAIFGSLFGAPPTWLEEAQNWTDKPDGSLNGTAIAEISASAENNKVYIINRGKNADGTARGWMKARILRNGNGYTLQYAEISATSINEIDITKDSDFNFNYVSFDNGAVQVEPKKAEWDIAFTIFTNLLPMSATVQIPYAYNDFVIQNRSNLEVALVSTEEFVYDTFTLSDTNSLTFSSEITTIGSTWRIVAQPGSEAETGVDASVFYVVRDSQNNVYKLQFTRMLNASSGERGYPQIKYDLLVD